MANKEDDNDDDDGDNDKDNDWTTARRISVGLVKQMKYGSFFDPACRGADPERGESRNLGDVFFYLQFIRTFICSSYFMFISGSDVGYGNVDRTAKSAICTSAHANCCNYAQHTPVKEISDNIRAKRCPK